MKVGMSGLGPTDIKCHPLATVQIAVVMRILVALMIVTLWTAQRRDANKQC